MLGAAATLTASSQPEGGWAGLGGGLSRPDFALNWQSQGSGGNDVSDH